MRLKLRGRVLLLTLAVAFAAVTLAGIVLNGLLERGFSEYLRRGQEERIRAALDELAAYYERYGSWIGLEREGFLPASLLAVADADRRLVLVRRFAPRMMRGMMHRNEVQELPVLVGGTTVGWAVFANPPPLWSSAADRVLRRVISRAILLGGLSATLLAVFLGLAFARQLTLPLAKIEAAARAMAGGRLETRAAIQGHDEVAVLAGALNDLAARVEALLEERRRLSADLAHELRTPLAVIRSLIESFADGVLPPDAEHLRQVREEIERLQILIERIQAAFLPERAEAVQEVLDLNALAGRLTARFAPRYREKGVELSLIPLSEPALCRATGDRLETALGNLLDNALKYSPAGTAVRVAIAAETGGLILTVADQGIGIAPEHQPRIFDRLYRADPSRSRETGGYGLGLAIAREIVEAHGGELTVTSEYGRGTVFTMRLPRVEA